MTIDLDHNAITRHSGHLRSAATAMNAAASQAGGINVGGTAFGVMCQFLPPIINANHPHHVDVLSGAADLLEITADLLDLSMKALALTDAQIAAGVNQLEATLDAGTL